MPLYLIPVTLGDTPHEQVLPPHNAETVRNIRHFVVEEIRTARRFLRSMDRAFPIDECTFYEMGKHASDHNARKNQSPYDKAIETLASGADVGVISEAGCPAVADPGADVVLMAQRRGLQVIPLAGPSSITMALMASGLSGQNFAFNGYLPIDEADRAKRLKALESRAHNEHQTQLFIETPFRNRKMTETLLRVLHPATRMCIAAGITTRDEWIKTHTIAEWRKIQIPDLSKIPAIFLIG